MRNARGTTVLCAVLVGMTLTACSGEDEDPEESTDDGPTAIAALSDIPEAVLVIKPDAPDAPKTYRTAEVTEASPSPDGGAVNVNFKAGPDVCSVFTGYATEESESRINVTVIVGEKDGCSGKSTVRTTVLTVDDPVGERDVDVSEYSKESLPIEDPKG